MDPSTESWALEQTMYVIQVAPAPGESTLLQAELQGSTYVLCYTTDEKARDALRQLEVGEAWVARVPGGRAVDLVCAMCQVGAVGIIVDLDPATKRCAWSRRLSAEA